MKTIITIFVYGSIGLILILYIVRQGQDIFVSPRMSAREKALLEPIKEDMVGFKALKSVDSGIGNVVLGVKGSKHFRVPVGFGEPKKD